MSYVNLMPMNWLLHLKFWSKSVDSDPSSAGKLILQGAVCINHPEVVYHHLCQSQYRSINNETTETFTLEFHIFVVWTVLLGLCFSYMTSNMKHVAAYGAPVTRQETVFSLMGINFDHRLSAIVLFLLT